MTVRSSLGLCAALWAGLLAAAEPAAEPAAAPPAAIPPRTIVLHADEAWQDLDADALHFRGGFTLSDAEREMRADRASLFGRWDAPERAVLEGEPATLRLYDPERNRTYFAKAQRIVYQRSPEVIEMFGGALMRQNGNELRSEYFRFERDSRRLTGGPGGVHGRLKTRTQPERAADDSGQ